jgi:hypothetical protein
LTDIVLRFLHDVIWRTHRRSFEELSLNDHVVLFLTQGTTFCLWLNDPLQKALVQTTLKSDSLALLPNRYVVSNLVL